MRPDASPTDVTLAFRRFALRHHPDRGGDPARFQAGLDAYRSLVPGRAPVRAPTDIVFHRRSQPRVSSLLRLATRRLAALRPRP